MAKEQGSSLTNRHKRMAMGEKIEVMKKGGLKGKKEVSKAMPKKKK